jgi:hypothetical protein
MHEVIYASATALARAIRAKEISCNCSGAVRSAAPGRPSIALLLKRSSSFPIAPRSGALPSGAISPATLPDSWYTRGALPMDIPP